MKKIIIILLFTIIWLFHLGFISSTLWGSIFFGLFPWFFIATITLQTIQPLSSFIYSLFIFVWVPLYIFFLICARGYVRIYGLILILLLWALIFMPSFKYEWIGQRYVTEGSFQGNLSWEMYGTSIATGTTLTLHSYSVNSEANGRMGIFNPIFCDETRCYDTMYFRQTFLELFPHTYFPPDTRRPWVRYIGEGFKTFMQWIGQF